MKVCWALGLLRSAQALAQPYSKEMAMKARNALPLRLACWTISGEAPLALHKSQRFCWWPGGKLTVKLA